MYWNPTTYRGRTLTWTADGKLGEDDALAYTYDGTGKRVYKDSTLKITNGRFTEYVYDSNGRLVRQGYGLDYIYDNTGLVGLNCNGSTYIYRKDTLGNIIAILDTNGLVVAKYVYDAWGNHKVFDASGVEIVDPNHVAIKNPFRYRSYYYDTETGLYYLKARYYDPETGRFISPDSIEYIDPETINGLNLYAYCGNNPVMNVDPEGHFGILATLLISTVVGAFVGSGVNLGKQLVQNDFDFSKVNYSEVGANALTGAATGLAVGLGGVAGGIVKGSLQTLTLAGKALTTSQSVGLLVGTATATNFAAGVAGYAMQTDGSKSNSFNVMKAFSKGIGQAGKGLVSFFTAGMYAASGFWKIGKGMKNTIASILGRTAGSFFANYVPKFVFDDLF